MTIAKYEEILLFKILCLTQEQRIEFLKSIGINLKLEELK